MASLIATKAPGVMCQGTAGEASAVKVKIQDPTLRTYGMVVYGFSIVEAENAAVMASIGKNVFVYCTNSSPVQITLKGVIGEISDDTQGKKFPAFYEENRVGNQGKLLKIEIDGTTYRAVFLSYSRQYSTTPSVTDEGSLTFLAVRE